MTRRLGANRHEPIANSSTPKGHWCIGGTRRVILANTGRDSWDVWLDLLAGEGRLRPLPR